MNWVNYTLVYLGVAVMVYNIYGFIRYARYIKKQQSWRDNGAILTVPIVLVILFLLGYLAVALFGQPDIVIASILFGGSIFVLFMHKYLSNITQRVMENERLKTDLVAVEKLNEAKANFLAGMSHEMHTPLNVILGMDALALKNPGLPPEARGQLEKIGLSAKHLLGLIDNALDMSRFETGTLAIAHEEFSLEEMLDQVDAIAHASCVEKGLAYVLKAPQRQGHRFMGDETNLKRVLLSIVDNAIKYTNAPGTVTLVAECAPAEAPLDRQSPGGDGLRPPAAPGEAGDQAEACLPTAGKPWVAKFSISDTGIGMDRDFLPQVFEAFTQEDAGSTSRHGGSGLSLAVANSLVELMGGSIAVESAKHVGSTFTVTVPLRHIASPETGAGKPGAESVEILNGARILIVEDIPDNAEIVADLLELEGADSEHAENGRVALDMIGRSPEWYYDAILMDLRMPVMDGLEATRNIRAMQRADIRAIPIIALTANAFEEDVKRSLEVGMNAHLAKPADSDMLYSTLARFIRKASEARGGEAA